MTTESFRQVKLTDAHCFFPFFAGCVKGPKNELSYLLLGSNTQYLTPKINSKTGEWDVRNIEPALKKHRRYLAACGRKTHEALLPYKVHPETVDSIPLKKIVDRMKEVNDLMVAYLNDADKKALLVGNNAQIRSLVVDALKQIVASVSTINAEAKTNILESLIGDIQTHGTVLRNDLEKVPFQCKRQPIDVFMGYELFGDRKSTIFGDAAGAGALSHEDILTKMKQQETEAVETLASCMLLTQEYIVAFLNKTGIDKVGTDIHKEWADILTAKAVYETQPDGEAKRAHKNAAMDEFVSAFLVELFEIMSSHAHAFFNLLIGRSNKNVTHFIRQFVDDWIRYCLAPLFWHETDVFATTEGTPISPYEYGQNTEHKLAKKLSRRVVHEYAAFDHVFITAVKQLLEQKPVDLSQPVFWKFKQELLVVFRNQLQDNNTTPIVIRRGLKGLDQHIPAMLELVNAHYDRSSLTTSREGFQTLLNDVPVIQGKKYSEEEIATYSSALTIPPLRPDALFDQRLAKIQAKLTLEGGTNLVQAYGSMLLYASKRLNHIFAGKYVIGGGDYEEKKRFAKQYFRDRHVFWVAAARAYVPGDGKVAVDRTKLVMQEPVYTVATLGLAAHGAHAVYTMFKLQSTYTYRIPKIPEHPPKPNPPQQKGKKQPPEAKATHKPPSAPPPKSTPRARALPTPRRQRAH